MTTRKGPEGFAVEALTPIAPPLWAYFRQLSGSEIFASTATIAQEDIVFIVNWRDDITTVHMVKYNGIMYNITRIDVFEGYKVDISLYCKLSGK